MTADAGAIPPFRRWTPPDFADLDRVARDIEARCPGAAPVAPLHVLGEGFFSVAVATAAGAVFRLGTAPDVFARYRKEWRVLPWIARQNLPLAIPRHRWLLPPDAAFPFGGIGYPLIEGRTLTGADTTGPHRARLAEQIAAFNLALHRLAPEEALALGVPDGHAGARSWHELDRSISALALEPVLTEAERSSIARWWDGFFEAFDARAYRPVFTHGDIGDENLLVAPSGAHLVGVLDWEHCAVGDPLSDFDGLQYLGRDFLFETLAAYERLGGPVLPGVEEYLEWHWQRGAFPAFRRAWQRGESLQADAVRASLRRHRVPE